MIVAFGGEMLRSIELKSVSNVREKEFTLKSLSAVGRVEIATAQISSGSTLADPQRHRAIVTPDVVGFGYFTALL